MIVEKRLDGSMQTRFKNQYLGYHPIGPADRTGLCPAPRSLPLARTPANGPIKEGQAELTARPSAVRPALGARVALLRSPVLPKANRVYLKPKPHVHGLAKPGCATSDYAGHHLRKRTF